MVHKGGTNELDLLIVQFKFNIQYSLRNSLDLPFVIHLVQVNIGFSISGLHLE